MTSPDFSDSFCKNTSDLVGQIHEFEYRKTITFTFFERCFSKKPFEKRREGLQLLKEADIDFKEGVLHGYNAPPAFNEIKNMGFGHEWAKSLMYAYYFSLPHERRAFQNHIISGVIAARPTLKRSRPITDFQNTATSEIGKRLFEAQANMVWTSIRNNALTYIAQDPTNPTNQVIQAVRTAQKTAEQKGLTSGVHALTTGLLPFFFRRDQAEFSQNKSQGPSYEVLQNVVQKKIHLEPFLDNFGWLFLTQGKYYQELELRDFQKRMPRQSEQPLLPLTFAHERE